MEKTAVLAALRQTHAKAFLLQIFTAQLRELIENDEAPELVLDVIMLRGLAGGDMQRFIREVMGNRLYATAEQLLTIFPQETTEENAKTLTSSIMRGALKRWVRRFSN